MSQAALSDGQYLGEGGLLLGGGETFAWGGGGNPRFPTPLYETLEGIHIIMYICTCVLTPCVCL